MSHAIREWKKTEALRRVGLFDLFRDDITQFGIEVVRESEKRLKVFERLSVSSPSIAKPHCCYMNTVIFYVYPHVVTRDGNFQEWERVDYLLNWDQEFLFEGKIYRAGGGRVIFHRKQWWARSWARIK